MRTGVRSRGGAHWPPRRRAGPRPGALAAGQVAPGPRGPATSTPRQQQRPAAARGRPDRPRAAAVELSIRSSRPPPALSKTSERRARPSTPGGQAVCRAYGSTGGEKVTGRGGASWSALRLVARPRDIAASVLLGLVSGGRLVVAKEPGSMRPSPAGRQRRSRVGGRLTQYQEHRARRTPATPGRQAATVVVATERGRSCPQ